MPAAKRPPKLAVATPVVKAHAAKPSSAQNSTSTKYASANHNTANDHTANLSLSARELIELVGMPAALYSSDGELIACNELFKAEFSSLDCGQSWTALRAHMDSAELALAKLAQSSEECYFPKLKRWYRLHHRSLARAGQQAQMSMLLLQNITERMDALSLEKAQHEKLLLTSRMMSVGEMTTTLAHELNQPLASIVNYLSTGLKLAERVENPPPRLKDALNLARQQAERAAQVIHRLREFVRTREPKRSPLRLLDTASQVLQMLDLEIKKFQVRIQIQIPLDLPLVFADKVMIEQVCFNLVKNALEAMRTVPQVQRQLLISARITLEGDAELRVIDRGSGLEASHEQQIFSPFFTTKSEGMGIGLSICRSIIEYHQGRIFFEANPEGGAIFGFRLPIPTEA